MEWMDGWDGGMTWMGRLNGRLDEGLGLLVNRAAGSFCLRGRGRSNLQRFSRARIWLGKNADCDARKTTNPPQVCRLSRRRNEINPRLPVVLLWQLAVRGGVPRLSSVFAMAQLFFGQQSEGYDD